MIFISNSEEETERLGIRIGKMAQPGTVVNLYGDLGSGKTALTRGIAKGLGIEDRVISPTFAIVNEYNDGRIPLFHFDFYRLESSDDLFDIGWEDYLERGGICVTEWTENCDDAMPEDAAVIRFSRGDSSNSRILDIEGLNI